MNVLEDIHNHARALAAMLPEAVENYHRHQRFAEALRSGKTIEMVNGEQTDDSEDTAQQEAWRQAIQLCRTKIDELTRLLVTHLPDTAKRCPLFQFSTLAGPDFTRPGFDADEFRRQCREIEVDAANRVLTTTGQKSPSISQAEFSRISGVNAGTVWRWAQAPSFALTREHAEQVLAEREKRSAPEVDGRAKRKQNFYHCKGCFETIITRGNDKPKCPKCVSSPGYDSLRK